ncbi:MAG: hypothetical protein KF752_08515 [Pirellulaceae bacterium]|nr:hypothetical protein [Pirellulaceae bacterium]
MPKSDLLGRLFASIGYLQTLRRKLAAPFRRVFKRTSAGVLTSRQRFGRKLPNPLAWLFLVVSYLLVAMGQRIQRKLIFLRPVAKSGIFPIAQKHLLALAGLPAAMRRNPALRKAGKNRLGRRLLRTIYHISLLQPAKWLIQCAGVMFGWARTRKWKRLLVASLPTSLLFVMIATVWGSGKIDRNQLAEMYFKLGQEEISAWEQGLLASGDVSTKRPPHVGTGQDVFGVPKLPTTLSSYAEMLFRRIELLKPTSENRIMIAASLLQRGAVGQSQRMLQSMAPARQVGNAKAHALMAMSLLTELQRARDIEQLPVFIHHATAAMAWESTPIEVWLAAADLCWRGKDIDRALLFYRQAAARSPEVYPVLVQRLAAAGYDELSDSVRRQAIEYFQQVLIKLPSAEKARIQIAQLLSSSEAGLNQAEAILKEGQSLRPSPALTRALSEVYRIRFLLVSARDKNPLTSFRYLDRAMVVDPTNPSVAESIGNLIQVQPDADAEEATRRLDDLVSVLNRILVTGGATTGTHAMLATLHMHQDHVTQAVPHLEQVYQVAPAAIKNAQQLMTAYAKLERFEDALKVAENCREIIRQRDLMNEKHVDELLETQAMVLQRLKRYPDAIGSYQLALEANPSRVETRILLAKLYRRLGDEQNARAQEDAVEFLRESSEELKTAMESSELLTGARESDNAKLDR